MNKNLLVGVLVCLVISAYGAPARDNDEEPCDTMKCRDGEKCAHITPMCAKGAAKCELQGICIPAQYAPPDSDEVQNSNVNAPRFGRDLNGESDPCEDVECEDGEKCTSVAPFCPEDSICHPKGVCVAAPDELF
uniref:Uncharacterized protein n=1 Tax=Panagrolaimus sp. ES5 TaxID=591445 RepID=A0AC34FFE6_9BILA